MNLASVNRALKTDIGAYSFSESFTDMKLEYCVFVFSEPIH